MGKTATNAKKAILITQNVKKHGKRNGIFIGINCNFNFQTFVQMGIWGSWVDQAPHASCPRQIHFIYL